jgi:hypothetical protein
MLSDTPGGLIHPGQLALG